MSSNSQPRRMRLLVTRLEQAGWRVRHCRRSSSWVCWPPEQHLPPVMIHGTQSCGLDDRNLAARLARSGWKGGV